jgi:predicted NAD-dependent protein-ADP-ribosyltransferase YbiA (DUF1768 family)
MLQLGVMLVVIFWGAMLVNNEWVGENTLGKIWMDLRNEHKKIGI